MKRQLIAIVFGLASSSAAFAFQVNVFRDGSGVVWSNICRNGPYYTVYPPESARPVGSPCAVLYPTGAFMMYGVVSPQ
jgi:hypothetical protein